MALAGNMKLRHFLILALVVGIATCGGVLLALHLYDAGKTVREVIEGDDEPVPVASVPPAGVIEVPAPTPEAGPEAAAQADPTPAPPIDAPAPTPEATPGTGWRLPDSSPAEIAAMRWRGKVIPDGKRKDTTKGQPFKVNVYQDEGSATCNRAKVDLDRDEKWDVKYTFDGERITRQIAPADDEDYTQTAHWTGESWVPE